MQEAKFSLTLEEANFLIRTLGQLPNSSNTYQLLYKIEKQAIESIQPSMEKNHEIPSGDLVEKTPGKA